MAQQSMRILLTLLLPLAMAMIVSSSVFSVDIIVWPTRAYPSAAFASIGVSAVTLMASFVDIFFP